MLLCDCRAAGIPQYIVSDSNTIYIDVILRHLGLNDCFDGIFTNPAEIVSEADGRQRITVGPYQPWDTPHHCKLCSVNLCKGAWAVVDVAK